jgi:hypothetical protein
VKFEKIVHEEKTSWWMAEVMQNAQFQNEINTPMRRKSSRRIFYVFLVAAAINGLSFMIISIPLGGDAINGTSEHGHYFLGDRGHFTEVSRGTWIYSRVHTILVFITLLALIPVAAAEWRTTKKARLTAQNHVP